VSALQQSGCAEEDIARFLFAMMTDDAKQQISMLNAGGRNGTGGESSEDR
jgi:hypothetical protein